MSSYSAWARHPKNRQLMKCEFIDGYFGGRKYGVKFPNGEVFDQDKWEIEGVTELGEKLISETDNESLDSNIE